MLSFLLNMYKILNLEPVLLALEFVIIEFRMHKVQILDQRGCLCKVPENIIDLAAVHCDLCVHCD